jgi:hypothetical protein
LPPEKKKLATALQNKLTMHSLYTIQVSYKFSYLIISL